MATTKWTTFLLLLSIFLLLSTSLALSSRREDERERELQQCRQQCQQQPHHDRGKQRECEKQCVEQHREREQGSERERERDDDSRRKDPEERLEQCRQRCTQRRAGQQQQCVEQCRERYEEERREQEGSQGRDNPERRDPEERLEECRQQCQQSQQEQQQKYQCQQQCEDRYQKERSQGSGGSSEEERRQGEGSSSSEEEEEEEEERSQNNPYVFRRESFIHRVRTQHGSIRVLQNFMQKSKLLLGIANYRLVIFEANPRTFAVPKYSDAEQVFFVTRGEGTVTLLRNEEERDQSQSIKRESHTIRKGSIIRVQAGTVVYIINNSNNQKLQIAKLVQPVFFPGQFKDFYIGGGENPESIYKTFSTSILEAALNTQQEKLQRLFGRQGQGAIVQASEEQIRGMSRPSSEGGHWPFGGQSTSRKPFNLLDKRPDHSNQRGQLYIADFEDYQELRDLDVHVAFTNITRGSMMAPSFESKATKIALVVGGSGEFEMVCPHLSGKGQRESEQEEEESEEGSQQGQRQYQKVRSRLSQGTVFIVPAGHPTAIIASQEQNLQVVCFEVHAKNSRKVFLTGRNNVVNQMEREAAELSFGVPYKLIEEVFGGSRDEVFVRGPGQSRERSQEEQGQGGSSPLEAFLEFSGF